MQDNKQLALFGIKHEQLTQHTTAKGSVSLTLKARGAGAFGYTKGGDKDANREAKAQAMAERIEIGNLIAEKGMPKLIELAAEGRIRFTRMNSTKGGGAISWRNVNERVVKVPAKLSDAQVAAYLGLPLAQVMKLKNVTPKAA